MPKYAYKARDGMGKPVKGTMEAVSKTELTDKLRRIGYMTTQVAETLPGMEINISLGPFFGVGTEDLIIFNVQLANLIHAGIPLLACLETLGKQIENTQLREAVQSITRAVEAGESFSDALCRYSKVFSKLFLNLVRAGEASGKLELVLERYAKYSEQQAELKQKITGALFYPVILLVAGLLVTLFIVSFIVPQFAEIFMKAGIELPLVTRLLYKAGLFIRQFWHTLILLTAVFWAGVAMYVGTPGGRLQFDWLKLKLPLFGPLFRKAAISRFARTFAMLVASGVPILQSLEIVQEVVGNEVLARVMSHARSAVEKGEKIAEPLRVSGEFPLDTVHMVAVGEETGNLDEMLDKVADFYDRSVEYAVKKLTTLLEPLLLLVLGCLVGFIMASMLLPMFDMMKLLRRGTVI